VNWKLDRAAIGNYFLANELCVAFLGLRKARSCFIVGISFKD
jgi:hypothetical protein